MFSHKLFHCEINLMDELTLKGVTQYYAFVQEKQKVHYLKHKVTSPLHVQESLGLGNFVFDIEMGQRWMRELHHDQNLNQEILEHVKETKENQDIFKC